MKIKELIVKLQGLNPDLEIRISDTYGEDLELYTEEIDEESIYLVNIDEYKCVVPKKDLHLYKENEIKPVYLIC